MKKQKSLYAVLFIALMAILIAPLLGVSPLIVGAVLTLASLVAKPVAGSFGMAITKEIWTKDIVQNLFKNNDFAALAFNADQYVINGKVVHIPVAGNPSSVNKNVTSFPVTAVKRTDADALYSIDTFYSTPRHIEKIEQYELAYDKRQSALGEDQAALRQAAMDNLLYRWAWKKSAGEAGNTVANTVLTTGDAQTSFLISGATGSRKKFTKDVFATIVMNWNVANIPAEKRVALLTAVHHQQLIDSFDVVAQTNFYRTADVSKGIVGEYLGVKVMMRSSVLRMRQVASVWTPIDEQASDFAATTDDSAASLFFHGDCVERALGNVDIFDNPNRAEYYGDIFSMELRMGGRQRRNEGVYVVVEDIVSA